MARRSRSARQQVGAAVGAGWTLSGTRAGRDLRKAPVSSTSKTPEMRTRAAGATWMACAR